GLERFREELGGAGQRALERRRHADFLYRALDFVERLGERRAFGEVEGDGRRDEEPLVIDGEGGVAGAEACDSRQGHHVFRTCADRGTRGGRGGPDHGERIGRSVARGGGDGGSGRGGGGRGAGRRRGGRDRLRGRGDGSSCWRIGQR